MQKEGHQRNVVNYSENTDRVEGHMVNAQECLKYGIHLPRSVCYAAVGYDIHDRITGVTTFTLDAAEVLLAETIPGLSQILRKVAKEAMPDFGLVIKD